MFTGLVSDIGEVRATEKGAIEIACGYELGDADIGVSIACDGCCLTVTQIRSGAGEHKSLFRVDVSSETLARSTLGAWTSGRNVNLERPLTPSSELGGHMVTGHVDGVAEILDRSEDGGSVRFSVRVEEDLARYIAPKGSVALNGVSLTVNEVSGSTFGVNIIPHTLEVTTWGEVRAGDSVNVEVDLLARYVARIVGAGQ